MKCMPVGDKYAYRPHLSEVANIVDYDSTNNSYNGYVWISKIVVAM